MESNDLLVVTTFQKLWENKMNNKKFCALLAYFEIDLDNTKLIADDTYVILYDQKKKEYIVLLSENHPLRENFLERKDRLRIKNLRFIFLQ